MDDRCGVDAWWKSRNGLLLVDALLAAIKQLGVNFFGRRRDEAWEAMASVLLLVAAEVRLLRDAKSLSDMVFCYHFTVRWESNCCWCKKMEGFGDLCRLQICVV